MYMYQTKEEKNKDRIYFLFIQQIQYLFVCASVHHVSSLQIFIHIYYFPIKFLILAVIKIQFRYTYIADESKSYWTYACRVMKAIFHKRDYLRFSMIMENNKNRNKIMYLFKEDAAIYVQIVHIHKYSTKIILDELENTQAENPHDMHIKCLTKIFTITKTSLPYHY